MTAFGISKLRFSGTHDSYEYLFDTLATKLWEEIQGPERFLVIIVIFFFFLIIVSFWICCLTPHCRETVTPIYQLKHTTLVYFGTMFYSGNFCFSRFHFHCINEFIFLHVSPDVANKKLNIILFIFFTRNS